MTTTGEHAYRGTGQGVRRKGKGRKALVIPTLLVLWFATGVLMMLLPLAAMASDPCNSAAEGLICTARGQMLCSQIPWTGGPVLAVGGTAAVFTRLRALRYGAVAVWSVGLVVMVMWVNAIAGTYHPN
ncbi:hypothetical protein [Yinghuangia aomiensis]